MGRNRRLRPEAYALLRTQDPDAYAEICGRRDRWRAHVRAGRWYEAIEEFTHPGPLADALLAGIDRRPAASSTAADLSHGRGV